METIGLIGFRKVVEDFAAVCKTIKQELANPDIASGIKDELVKLGNQMLANPDIASGIKDELVKLGNQMDAQLDGLGETLKSLMEAEAEDPEPAADSKPDATGDARPLTDA